MSDDEVLRPRTVRPGPAGPDRVVRPRTIGALGAPEAVPLPEQSAPLESFADPTWQPPTGQVPVTVVDQAEPDPDIWTDETEAAAEEAHETVPASGVPERGGLLRSNLIVASGTLTSRFTGLIRTSLILLVLGSGLNDAYVTANNTPNMIYELILGGILTAALVPLFTDDLERGDGRDATSAIISFALVALLVVTVIALIAAPLIILIFSLGSPEGARDDYLAAAVPLALLFAPQVFFYGLMAVWSAVLNARQRFLAAAWAPVLNNLIAIATLIGAAQLVDGRYPTLQDALDDRRILWLLGAGTTLGIVVMALSLYPAIRRAGVRLRFKFDLKHPAVRRTIRLSGWMFGYVIANQVAVLVIQTLAEPGTGGNTRYQTAFQYFQLPHALLAVSIMVTFEPLLGRADARDDRPGYNRQLLLGYRLIGLLIIPAAVGYIALPGGLDARTFEATGELAKALDLTGIIAAFAVGLPGFSTYLYTLRGFYAMKDTRTPFLINCGENAINIVLAIVFVRWWGVVGLALSFAIAYNVSAVVAVGMLARRSRGFDLRGLLHTWVKLLVAAGIMGGFVYGVVSLMAPSSAAMLVPAIGVGLVVGGVTYFAAVYVLGVPGIAELMARLPGARSRRSGAADQPVP